MATTDIDSDPELDAEANEELTGDGEGAEMSLVEHLDELRKRLFVCVIAIVVTTVVAFIFNDAILRFMLIPLPISANALINSNVIHTSGDHVKLVVTGIGEGFSVALKLALVVGIAAATPIWLWQLWGFLAPALTRKEKKYALPFVFIGVGLFAAGIGVGFLVLRYPIDFLIHFGSNNFIELISAESYLSFVSFFLLAFGITFELPLVLTFMAVVGITNSQFLAKNRSYILVGLWVASCFITPGADPYSPVILGISFTLLYFLSEGLIRAIGK